VLQHNSRGGYISITNSTKHDTLAVWARKQTSDPIDNIFLELFKENQDGSTGQRILSQDISSLIPSGAAVHIEVAIDGGLIVQAGERYLARVRNSTTTSNYVWVAGIWQQSFAVDASWRTSVQAVTEKTVYTTAEAAQAKIDGTVLPWLMLAAKTQMATDKSYGDDFNRQNLGNLWTVTGSGSNKLIIRNDKLSYGGGTQDTQKGIYNRTVETDHMRVDARLTGSQTTPRSGLIISSDAAMSNFVWLGVNAGTVGVYSFTTPGGFQLRSNSPVGGDAVWSIYYDDINNKYRVLKDDLLIPALDWTDSGNIISHGPDNRFGGGAIQAIQFFLDHIRGADIDNWNVKDWVEV
jgi:hypothetical protein